MPTVGNITTTLMIFYDFGLKEEQENPGRVNQNCIQRGFGHTRSAACPEFIVYLRIHNRNCWVLFPHKNVLFYTPTSKYVYTYFYFIFLSVVGYFNSGVKA